MLPFASLRVNIDKNQQQVIVGDPSFSRLKDFSEKQGCCTSPHSRWLAPESILDGEFTEKSDVVSDDRVSGGGERGRGTKPDAAMFTNNFMLNICQFAIISGWAKLLALGPPYTTV